MNYEYIAERYSLNIYVKDYIKKFRNVEKFREYCLECPNYAKSWTCPPFECNIDKILTSYKSILLLASKITPLQKDIPFSESGQLIVDERKYLQRRLLDMEKEYSGFSLTYTRTCLYCPKGTCTRLDNQPCRHPRLIRPSLEACGFDIGRTTSELFVASYYRFISRRWQRRKRMGKGLPGITVKYAGIENRMRGSVEKVTQNTLVKNAMPYRRNARMNYDM